MREPRPATVALALYVAALVPRLALAFTRPFGDEAHHYYIARHFGQGPSNVHGMLDNEWLFWWRPLFSLLLSPGSQFGFTGFRLGYVLMVALLAPLLWWWLRGRGVGQRACVAAGLAVALHPFLVVWGVRAFPDELMATAFVGGLALWERGRTWAGAATLLAACWIKEVALVGVAVVLAEELLLGMRVAQRALTVRIDGRHAALAAVLALAYLPHLYAERIGGRPPGWSRGGDAWAVADGAFTTVWLIPFVAAALLEPRSRRPALLALAYLAFFLAYTVVLDGRAEQWYFVMPTVLAAAALCAGYDAARRRASAGAGRWARPAAAVVLALVLAQAVVPASAAKQDALHPGVDGVDLSYAQMVRDERRRDQDLWTTLDQLQGADLHNVLLVDVAWFFAIWPVSERADFVATAYTQGSVPDEVWAAAIEQVANTTILQRGTTPLSLALGDVYGDCITDASPQYVILRGQACAGRLDRLRAAYEARAAAAG